MSGQTLADVIGEHMWSDTYGCDCGTGPASVEWGAHVEAAVLDWLRARLASDEVREAVAAEWQRPEHAPMSDHDPRTGECVSCPWPAYMVLGPSGLADAALTAVLAALEVER